MIEDTLQMKMKNHMVRKDSSATNYYWRSLEKPDTHTHTHTHTHTDTYKEEDEKKAQADLIIDD